MVDVRLSGDMVVICRSYVGVCSVRVKGDDHRRPHMSAHTYTHHQGYTSHTRQCTAKYATEVPTPMPPAKMTRWLGLEDVWSK
jgi:hypothetical protein